MAQCLLLSQRLKHDFFPPECNQMLQNPFFQFFYKGKICKSPRKVYRKPSEIKSNKRARERQEKIRKVFAKCRPNVQNGAESVTELQYRKAEEIHK